MGFFLVLGLAFAAAGCYADRMIKAPETLEARCAKMPEIPACRYRR